MSTTAALPRPGPGTRRRPAVLLMAPHSFALGEVEEPVPEIGEVAVDILYTGLCGTDLHIVAGEHPRARFPLALGHELVGRVVTGADTGRLVVVDPLVGCGSCVACVSGLGHVCVRLRLVGIDSHGGLAGRVVVPAERVHAVPGGVTPETAALAEPLAVAVHAVGRSPVAQGSRVVVVGAGPIGLLLALVIRQAGVTDLFIAERAPARRTAAEDFGFALLDADDPVADLAARSADRMADVAFDAAAAPAVAAMLPSLVRPGGTVSLVGVYDGLTPIDLRAVVFREITLVGDRVYTPGDIDHALGLLATPGGSDVSRLVSAIVPVSETADALVRLRAGEGMKYLVDLGTLA